MTEEIQFRVLVREDKNQTGQGEAVWKLTIPGRHHHGTGEAKRGRDLQEPRGGDRLLETGTTQPALQELAGGWGVDSSFC